MPARFPETVESPIPKLANAKKPVITRRMIRKAAIPDIPEIHRLLSLWGARGDLLARPLSQLYDHLRDFWVWSEPPDGAIVGCCGLQFCWEDLAEIRSLAVHPDHHRRNIGRKLVEAAMAEARSFGIRRVFTLTYRPAFFRKLGFHLIDRAELPLKIWSDCIACVNFPNCDENAMMREFAPDAAHE
jgi:amino-acid N-acetyltransferase